ncbi:hypothetical protein Poli38472_001294 [Pythium oligandrum]|uniref:Uncharacterized protein n=1 Tax=Pythium oligandrum TaxID=41045 RepID=A0A8K1CUD6_PYTOL|nr:hypothetical protein Poli38472_001294 [Pythium oligandrum]|eukprot:TMW69138.1 hypothetical protein Poli38472_001294 [Pythium oligandrum]
MTWDFVSPWWALLKRHGLSVRLVDKTECLHAYRRFEALEITPVVPQDEPEYRQVWRKQRDAMELLALMALVDLPAWTEMLQTNTGRGEAEFRGVKIEEGSAIRFCIKLDHKKIGKPSASNDDERMAWPGELITDLFTPLPLEERSPEFRDARECILQRLKPKQLLEYETRTIPVLISIDWIRQDQLTAALTAISSVFARAQEGRVLEECRFELDSVQLEFQDHYYKYTWLDTTRKSLSLPITRATFQGAGSVRHNLLSAMRHELCSLVDGGPDKTLKHSLRSLTLHAPPATNNLPGVFSLFASQQHALEALRLQYVFGNTTDLQDDGVPLRALTMRWLGYLLFSPHSDASFHTLQITDQQFRRQDFQWIHSIYEAENPFPLLHPQPWSSSQPLMTARALQPANPRPNAIRPNDFVGYDDEVDDGLEDLAVWTQANRAEVSPDTVLYVMDNDPHKPTVDVLIHGFGVFTVDRTQVSIFPFSAPPQRPARCIRHLFFSLNPDNEDEIAGLQPFIRLIGDSLESLSIGTRFYPMIDDEMLHCIATACPNLKCLRLHRVKLSSWLPLIDLFETHRRHVSTLELTNLNVFQPDTLRLISLLEDPKSVLSSSLRELTLELPYSKLSTIRAIIDTLQQNKSLQYLEIGTPARLVGEALKAAAPFHNEIIPGVHQKLSMASKVALLSVFGRQVGRDNFAISTVFEFAAEPLRRGVRVRSANLALG